MLIHGKPGVKRIKDAKNYIILWAAQLKQLKEKGLQESPHI